MSKTANGDADVNTKLHQNAIVHATIHVATYEFDGRSADLVTDPDSRLNRSRRHQRLAEARETTIFIGALVADFLRT